MNPKHEMMRSQATKPLAAVAVAIAWGIAAASTDTGHYSGVWPQGFVKKHQANLSNPKTKVAAKTAKTGTGAKGLPGAPQTGSGARPAALRSADGTRLIWDGNVWRGQTPDEAEAERADLQRRGEACSEAGRIANGPQPAEGEARLREIIRTDQMFAPFASLSLARALVKQGRYRDTCEVLGPYVDSNSGFEEINLLASLAATRCGEVYEGQEEYCVGRLRFGYPADMTEITGDLPTGHRPAGVGFITELCLGGVYENQGPLSLAERYYRDALRQDPGNFVANYRLARICHLEARESEAKGLLAVARRRAATNSAKVGLDGLESQIDRSIMRGHSPDIGRRALERERQQAGQNKG